MTDFRALCVELFENLERYQCWYIEDNGYGIDGLEALLDRADAALAQPEPEFTPEEVEMIQAPWSYLTSSQPEPQGPTDEELGELWDKLWAKIDEGEVIWAWQLYARAVLARWGRPAIEPVPVAERLPGPTDEALLELFNQNNWNYISPETFLDIAHSVLELQ